MANRWIDMMTLKSVRQRFREIKRRWRAGREYGELEALRRQIHQMAAQCHVELDEFVGELTDAANGYIQYKDLFLQQIYRFQTTRPNPLIIDSGSNIGMSIVYFKREYPQAEVIGFEPDPEIFAMLERNVEANALNGVTLVKAALGAEEGTACFTPDGEAGGKVEQAGDLTVDVVPLSRYANRPVDFLKLNIEGAELEVLQELAETECLQNVREMVIEYHGWPNGRQCLGEILNLLDTHGFRYLLHDFDRETCGTTKPPFHLTEGTTWFCLIYAVQPAVAKSQAA